MIATSSREVPGGKGANQAIAAARLGANVTMIGSVGDDAFADSLLENLKREGIDVTRISRRANCASGIAVVAVEDSGENSIVVVPGANGTLGADDVRAAADVIRGCDILLLQLEVPIEVVLLAMEIARTSGTRIVLDPAPVPTPFPPELLHADLVCPNETEAAAILRLKIEFVAAAHDAVSELMSRGARNAIITLGEQGAVVSDGDSTEWIQPFLIDPVDTTASGDAFAAAVAVHWNDGHTLIEAARFGCAAGAICAQHEGAQPGLPNRIQVEQLMRAAK